MKDKRKSENTDMTLSSPHIDPRLDVESIG